MKLVLGFAVPLAFCLVLLVAAPEENTPKPHYDAKGNLLRPTDYRDWEFLSAGYGMNYSPAPGGHELFTNVFVQRWAYEAQADQVLKPFVFLDLFDLKAAHGDTDLHPNSGIATVSYLFEGDFRYEDSNGTTGVLSEFVIGTAAPHPYELKRGSYSVHTSTAALQAAERRLVDIRQRLETEGRLNRYR